jgi:hypothetical protein
LGGILEDAAAADRKALNNQASAPLKHLELRHSGSKKKVFPVKTAAGKWHDLVVRIQGDTVSVSIDGKEAGAFASEGFAHPTKKMLRLSVPHDAVVDDVKIWKK